MDFDKEQVAAIYVNDSVICINCMKDEDWNSLTQLTGDSAEVFEKRKCGVK